MDFYQMELPKLPNGITQITFGKSENHAIAGKQKH